MALLKHYPFLINAGLRSVMSCAWAPHQSGPGGKLLQQCEDRFLKMVGRIKLNDMGAPREARRSLWSLAPTKRHHSTRGYASMARLYDRPLKPVVGGKLAVDSVCHDE